MCMQALNVQAASQVEMFCSRNTFSPQNFDLKYKDQFGVIVQHLPVIFFVRYEEEQEVAAQMGHKD